MDIIAMNDQHWGDDENIVTSTKNTPGRIEVDAIATIECSTCIHEPYAKELRL